MLGLAREKAGFGAGFSASFAAGFKTAAEGTAAGWAVVACLAATLFYGILLGEGVTLQLVTGCSVILAGTALATGWLR